MPPNYSDYEQVRKRYGEDDQRTKSARISFEHDIELAAAQAEALRYAISLSMFLSAAPKALKPLTEEEHAVETELLSDYRTTYAKHGAYAKETRLSTTALQDAGINIPTIESMYGGDDTKSSRSPVIRQNKNTIPKKERTGEELIKEATDQVATDTERVKLHETFAEETLAPSKVKQSTKQYKDDLNGGEPDIPDINSVPIIAPSTITKPDVTTDKVDVAPSTQTPPIIAPDVVRTKTIPPTIDMPLATVAKNALVEDVVGMPEPIQRDRQTIDKEVPTINVVQIVPTHTKARDAASAAPIDATQSSTVPVVPTNVASAPTAPIDIPHTTPEDVVVDDPISIPFTTKSGNISSIIDRVVVATSTSVQKTFADRAGYPDAVSTRTVSIATPDRPPIVAAPSIPSKSTYIPATDAAAQPIPVGRPHIVTESPTTPTKTTSGSVTTESMPQTFPSQTGQTTPQSYSALSSGSTPPPSTPQSSGSQSYSGSRSTFSWFDWLEWQEYERQQREIAEAQRKQKAEASHVEPSVDGAKVVVAPDIPLPVQPDMATKHPPTVAPIPLISDKPIADELVIEYSATRLPTLPHPIEYPAIDVPVTPQPIEEPIGKEYIQKAVDVTPTEQGRAGLQRELAEETLPVDAVERSVEQYKAELSGEPVRQVVPRVTKLPSGQVGLLGASSGVGGSWDDEDELVEAGYVDQSALRYQRTEERLAKRKQREEEEIDRYPTVGGLLLQRPMSALEREHYDAQQTYGDDSPITRKLELEVAKRRLTPLTEESRIPLLRTPEGDTGFFAPPPKSIEEREKGLLDTLIAPLLWGEQASGTAIYGLRKKLGFEGIDWIEQAEEGEIFKEISPSMALGITTRETDIFTARGAAGLAIDIALDPTTYVGIGLIGKAGKFGSKLAKSARITGKAGDVVTVGRKAARMVGEHTGEIRKAFPQIPIEHARKMAEEEVFEYVAKHPELLAARKYVEPSLHFMGHPAYVVKPVKRLLGKAWKVAPFAKKRAAAVETLQTWFTPFHKARQAAGEHAAEMFAKFYRATEYQRGEWGKRAAGMARKRPFFVKRASEEDFNKQVRQYLESGVEPEDAKALEEAIEIRKGYEELFEREIEAGLITREQLRPEYMYHTLTPEAKEFLKKELGSEFREGEEAYTYVRQLESAQKRTYEGTIDEMNERMLREHGVEKFFVEDPLKAFFLRGVESARAIESHKLDVSIKTGEWTKTVEEMSPVAGRTTEKFTSDVIAEKATAKYGERIEKLRAQLEIPEGVEVTTLDDIMQYAQRERADEGMLKSIDEQIAEVDAKLEAGIWRAEEGVLGVKPDAVTTTERHITKPGREAKERLVELRAEREFIQTGGKREEMIGAFDIETAELYAKKSDEYLEEASKSAQKTREKFVDARDRLDDLKSSKKVRDDYLEEVRKETTRTKAHRELMRGTKESLEDVYEAVGKGRGVAPPSPLGMEDILPHGQLEQYTKDFEETIDLLHVRRGTEYTAPTAQEIESAQELLSPHVKYFTQQEALAKRTYGKSSRDYERLLKQGVPPAEIPAVKKQAEKVEKLESLLQTAEDIESEYAGAVIRVGKGEPIGDVLMETDVPKLAKLVGGREAKREVFIGDLDKKLTKSISDLEASIVTKTATVEAATIPSKTSGEYKKLVKSRDDLVVTRDQVTKFYTDYGTLPPEQLATEAKRMAKLTGITGEDKKLFTDLATGVKLLDEYSAQAGDVAEWGAKTRVAAPKKNVMRDGVEWEYQEKYGTYVPKALIKEIEETVPVDDMWTRHYDPFLSVIRKGYIGYWPAYYTRNIYSAAWQNMYRRVGVEDYATAVATKYGDPEAMIDLGPMYGKVRAGELKEMMEKQGVTGQIGFVDVPEMFMETGAIGGLSLTKGIQTTEASMQWAMKTTEDLARMPLYIKTMRQGASPEQAAAVVRQFQFEYGAAGLTTFEKRKMKRAFLFYTWARKNIPLQMEMLAEQPGTFAAAFKTREMMISPEEYNELPEWAKEGFARGGEGGKFYVMDVPLTDLPGLYGREEVFFGVNPVAKFSMAMTLGYDPSTKVPLETPEAWADFFAKTFVGRYKSFFGTEKGELARMMAGEITPETVAIHQLGGVYAGEYRGLPAKQAYKAARMYEWRPREEDYVAAFEGAGIFGAAHYETIWRPEARPRGEVFTKEKKWYETVGKNINVFSPSIVSWKTIMPWTWGEKASYTGETGLLLGYTEEQQEAIAGHQLTDEQKEEVKRVYEERGAEFAAGYRTMMAEEYHEARAAIGGREPTAPTQITEAYHKLVQRVGKERAQDGKVKTFYTTEGKPHVMMITEAEAEEWGDWRPPQEVIDWLYEDIEGEVQEMPLDQYEQYIEIRDVDYMLSPKERGEKRGREVSWKLERARAKVEEIKATIVEGTEPTQELIDAEEELQEAQTSMAEFIRGDRREVSALLSDFDRGVAEFDAEFWDYYEAAERGGEIKDLGEDEVVRQAVEFAERQTGIRPAISPLERPKPTEEMLAEPFVSMGRTIYDQKFFEEYERLKEGGMIEALGRKALIEESLLDEELVAEIGEKEVISRAATDEERIKVLGEEAVERMAFEYASLETGIPLLADRPTMRPLPEDVTKKLLTAYEETGFMPSKAQMDWALRTTEDTQVVSEERFDELMEERVGWGAEEHAVLQDAKANVETITTSLEKWTGTDEGRIELEEELVVAEKELREAHVGVEDIALAPIRMTFGEQIDIWSAEHEAEVEQDRLYREEYVELRSDIRGTTKIQKDEYITTSLLLTRGGEDIGNRMMRKQELEEMLGVGVDR